MIKYSFNSSIDENINTYSFVAKKITNKAITNRADPPAIIENNTVNPKIQPVIILVILFFLSNIILS